MDEQGFDRLARRLAASQDRRSAIRLVAGGLVGASLGASALPAHAKHAKQCGVMTCQPNWKCCKKIGGCYDKKYLRCCSQGLCAKGLACCGSAQCCQKHWKCCGHGVCCPSGWRCGKYACEASFGASPAATIPFAKAQPADTRDWVERGWLTLVGGD